MNKMWDFLEQAAAAPAAAIANAEAEVMPAVASVAPPLLGAGGGLAGQAASVFGHYGDSPDVGGVAAAAAKPGLLDQAIGGISSLAHGAVSAVESAGSAAYHGLTDWHFEGRQARNGAPPSDAELHDPKGGWSELPPWMTVYHDNGVGAPEHKYINPDGRESVRDGDTGAEVTDPRYMATYNYCNPMKWEDAHGVGGVAEFAARSVGHFGADILPYWLGGNVRGPG